MCGGYTPTPPHRGWRIRWGGGYFASGRGTFQGWKVPKDPRVVVLTKSASFGTSRHRHPSLRSLAPTLPIATTPLGCNWVPGGSAPYDFRTRSARLENGLNLFGAGMNLGPLRSPLAAARAGQIRRSFFSHIAPLACLAFWVPFVGAAPCGGPRPDGGIGPYGVALFRRGGLRPPRDHKGRSPLYRKKGGLGGN